MPLCNLYSFTHCLKFSFWNKSKQENILDSCTQSISKYYSYLFNFNFIFFFAFLSQSIEHKLLNLDNNHEEGRLFVKDFKKLSLHYTYSPDILKTKFFHNYLELHFCMKKRSKNLLLSKVTLHNQL